MGTCPGSSTRSPETRSPWPGGHAASAETGWQAGCQAAGAGSSGERKRRPCGRDREASVAKLRYRGSPTGREHQQRHRSHPPGKTDTSHRARRTLRALRRLGDSPSPSTRPGEGPSRSAPVHRDQAAGLRPAGNRRRSIPGAGRQRPIRGFHSRAARRASRPGQRPAHRLRAGENPWQQFLFSTPISNVCQFRCRRGSAL